MSGSLSTKQNISREFSGRATGSSIPPKTRPRSSPLSLRLSDEERVQLEADANGAPLGAYIKACVFENGSGAKKRPRSVVQDYEALARLLAAMGRSDVFANLEVLARQAERGQLILSPDAEYEITVTCACVLQMRDDLIYALGLRPESGQ